MRIAADRNDQDVAQRLGELQMLDVPGMNNVEAAVAVDERFPLRAGRGADGQERLKRTGLTGLRHRFSVYGRQARTAAYSSESSPPLRELSDAFSLTPDYRGEGTERADG